MLPENTDSRLVTWAARSYYDDLVKAGVVIWQYKKGLLHAKTMVIDDQFGFIGTANFDIRSFRLNYELGINFYNSEFADQLTAQFKRDLEECDRVPQERHLKFLPRLAEACARLCSPLL